MSVLTREKEASMIAKGVPLTVIDSFKFLERTLPPAQDAALETILDWLYLKLVHLAIGAGTIAFLLGIAVTVVAMKLAGRL